VMTITRCRRSSSSRCRRYSAHCSACRFLAMVRQSSDEQEIIPITKGPE
jgi:hypothetical protein